MQHLISFLHISIPVNSMRTFPCMYPNILYNYADDNTLSFSSPDYDILISTLEAESQVLIDWFKDNKMHANPDKFQVLAVGKKTFAKNPSVQIQNNILSCEETVKLLGIDI